MATRNRQTKAASAARGGAAIRDSKGHKLKTNVDTLGERIKKAREARGLTQDTLAKDITRILEHQGVVDKARGRSSIAQWETGRAFPEYVTLSAIAKAVDKSPEYIAFGVTDEPRTVFPEPEELGYVLAPEIVVEGDDSFTKTCEWGLPIDWLRSELGVTSYKDVAIYKVDVNGDKFEFGDRVIIDRSNAKPSPPGHFLYWDGVGANIARMVVVPGGRKPRVRVEGPSGTYEADVDKIAIIGRVKGIWKKA
jgi:transcriptional regulator with XRE-family HTH domain